MSLRVSMAKGAAWMISLRFFVRLIGMFSTIILARLLVPADFGLVAMATVIMGLVVMLSETNVEAVLVQRPDIDRSYLDSAFGLKLLVASTQAVLLASLAVPIAAFYNEPRLEPIVYVLGAAVFIDGLQNIGIVAFQRELQFHREFVMKAAPKIAAFVVTVGVALTTGSYWALVAGIVANNAGRTLLSYLLHPFRPRPSRQHWREIFRFSKWLILNQGLIFFGQRGPDLALGRLVGARAVGLFSVAYDIAMLPTTEMIAPINRAVFPAYSRMTATAGELRRGYLEVAGLVTLLAMPAGVGIAVTAPVLVPLLLGSQWGDAVPLIEILSIAGVVRAASANSGPVFLALGRPYIITGLEALRTGMLAAGIVYSAHAAGAWGVALAYLVVMGLMLPVQITTTLRVVDARLSDYARVIYRPIVASVVMYGLTNRMFLPQMASLGLPLPVQALALIALGAATYALAGFLLWQAAGRPAGAEQHALEIGRRAFTKLRRRAA